MEDSILEFGINDSPLDILELKTPNYGPYQIEYLLELHENKRYPTLVMLNELSKYHTQWIHYTENIKKISTKIIELNGSNTINIHQNQFGFLYINKFDEKFADYLKPLIHPDSQWNEDLLNTFLKICNYLEKNTSPLVPVNESTVNSLFDNQQIKSFVELQQTDSKQIKELMVNICKYNVNDYSVATYYLLQTRNNIVNLANDCWILLRNSWMNNDIHFEELLNRINYEGLFALYPPFNFNILFENWKIELLTTIHSVLNNDDIKQLISDEFEDKLYDPSYKPSFNHPEIEKYADYKIRYALSQLRIIYTNGWEYWVKRLLSKRGIGIQKLSFDCGIWLKLESVCIYWFDKSFDSASISIIKLWSLCQMAEENKFYDLLDKILGRFGKLLTSEYYFKKVQETISREDYCSRLVYLRHWEIYFCDDVYVNCENINKAKLVRELWHHLPKKELGNKVPLMKNIKLQLHSNIPMNMLSGKDMHFINDDWRRVPAFFFDNDMNDFGKFKRICMSICNGSVERSVKKMKCI